MIRTKVKEAVVDFVSAKALAKALKIRKRQQRSTNRVAAM
jgi:hypothetical protein